MSKKSKTTRTWTAYAEPPEVVPNNDLRPHTCGMDCWCKPEDDGVIIHNALDGREKYENGERKLS